MNDSVTDEWVSFVIGCSPKSFSSLAGLKVALGLKKKKKAKDERTFIMLYIIRLSLSHSASKWKPMMPSFSPSTCTLLIQSSAGCKGAGSLEISRLKSCKFILPRFKLKLFLPSSLEPVDFCFGCDRSRNRNTSTSRFQNHRQDRKTRETREPIRRSGWQFNMKNEDKEQRGRLFPALLPTNLEKEFS